jgi:hypothetical protein
MQPAQKPQRTTEMIMQPTLSIDPGRQQLIEVAHNLRREAMHAALSETARALRTILAPRPQPASRAA